MNGPSYSNLAWQAVEDDVKALDEESITSKPDTSKLVGFASKSADDSLNFGT